MKDDQIFQLHNFERLRYRVFKTEQMLQFLLYYGQHGNSTYTNSNKSFKNLKHTQTRKESYITINNTKPSSNEYTLRQPTTITASNMHQG